ncbi:MAG: ester cyclase [Gammaproteobacteria bacterium]|nr:ester cyclase [Gammaproteobacteria bacterium]
MTSTNTGAYGAEDSLVDYILGITFEIWEEQQVELIDQYYAPETVVYSLDGITRGASAMIDGTRSMLAAFPDRLLLGDDVIGKGDAHKGYSSHRVVSPMTNTGQTVFGPATGKQVRIMNMADCVVEEGIITLEWLARDNLALVRQLGFDARASATIVAEARPEELLSWFEDESRRLTTAATSNNFETSGDVDPQSLLRANWVTGDADVLESAYAPYAVMHRSPVETISGRNSITSHYSRLRNAFDIGGASVDHVCTQPAAPGVHHVASRWAVCGTHQGDYLGISASGKPVYIMGVTHQRIVDGRIAIEWTVFDSLGVMAQLL